MSKVVAIAASLKAVMLIATGAFARGDMLPVILISAIFDLGLQIRRKAGHTEAACTAGDYQLSQKGAGHCRPGDAADAAAPLASTLSGWRASLRSEPQDKKCSPHNSVHNFSGTVEQTMWLSPI